MNKGSIHYGLPRASSRGFSPILLTAVISIAVFLAIAGWQIQSAVQQKRLATTFVATSATVESPEEKSAPSDLETIAKPAFSPVGESVIGQMVGVYNSLAENGGYTPTKGEEAAKSIASNLVADIPYKKHSGAEIRVDADTSFARTEQYGDELRAALAPLRKNTQPEFEIFAYYVETKDISQLVLLQRAAEDYRAAARAAAAILVPFDIVVHHVDLINSLEKFASTLDALAVHADDPFAVVAVLRAYNQAENDIMTASTLLAKYYQSKRS